MSEKKLPSILIDEKSVEKIVTLTFVFFFCMFCVERKRRRQKGTRNSSLFPLCDVSCCRSQSHALLSPSLPSHSSFLLVLFLSPDSDRIGCTYAGIGPDFRVLVKRARKNAQLYYRQYHQSQPVSILVKEVASVMQEFTQQGSGRDRESREREKVIKKGRTFWVLLIVRFFLFFAVHAPCTCACFEPLLTRLFLRVSFFLFAVCSELFPSFFTAQVTCSLSVSCVSLPLSVRFAQGCSSFRCIASCCWIRCRGTTALSGLCI